MNNKKTDHSLAPDIYTGYTLSYADGKCTPSLLTINSFLSTSPTIRQIWSLKHSLPSATPVPIGSSSWAQDICRITKLSRPIVAITSKMINWSANNISCMARCFRNLNFCSCMRSKRFSLFILLSIVCSTGWTQQ